MIPSESRLLFINVHLELLSIRMIVSNSFPDETSYSTIIITSLGTFNKNAKDSEIWMIVEEELIVTNFTGDRVAASKDCTYLTVVFLPIQ
jgi:hypothetical protein